MAYRTTRTDNEGALFKFRWLPSRFFKLQRRTESLQRIHQVNFFVLFSIWKFLNVEFNFLHPESRLIPMLGELGNYINAYVSYERTWTCMKSGHIRECSMQQRLHAHTQTHIYYFSGSFSLTSTLLPWCIVSSKSLYQCELLHARLSDESVFAERSVLSEPLQWGGAAVRAVRLSCILLYRRAPTPRSFEPCIFLAPRIDKVSAWRHYSWSYVEANWRRGWDEKRIKCVKKKFGARKFLL